MKYIKEFKIFESNDIITELNYSIENLTQLPELPNSLEILYCKYNKLTELPELPNSLNYLNCSNNNLTELKFNEYKPLSLKIFYGYYNKLPYKNIDELKKWHKENYSMAYEIEKFNL